MFHFPLFTRLSSTLTESISLEGMEIVGLWITLFGNNCNLRITIFSIWYSRIIYAWKRYEQIFDVFVCLAVMDFVFGFVSFSSSQSCMWKL